MSNDTTDSKPNPILMYDIMTSFIFQDAAWHGFCESGGKKYSAGQLIASSVAKPKNLTEFTTDAGVVPTSGLAEMGAFLGANRVCTMIVLNHTHSALRLKDNTFNNGTHHGVQTLHPAKAKMEVNGNVSYTDPNIIPGPILAPINHFNDLVGVGIYRFEKDLSAGLGVYGVSGALSFQSMNSDRPEDVAVAFNVGQGSPNTVAITVAPEQNGGVEGMKRYIDSLDGPVLNSTEKSQIGSRTLQVAASLYPWDPSKDTNSNAKHNAVLMVNIS